MTVAVDCGGCLHMPHNASQCQGTLPSGDFCPCSKGPTRAKASLTLAIQRLQAERQGDYATFLREVIACPCGVSHDRRQLEEMRQDALGRVHLRRWEPREDNGYYERNGTGEYVPGARDFEGEP